MPRCADAACGRRRLFGALQFNGSWYCSKACVEQAALEGLDGDGDAGVAGVRPKGLTPSIRPLKLGVLLRHAGAITDTQLDAALVVKARTGLRIGEQLEQLGFAGSDVVLRALATQAGVSYLSTFDIARVKRAPASLPPAMVRALGLVPFEADEIGRRLYVIAAAPLPRAAMRAMTRLTEWSLEVYLVSDAVFDAALDAYQPAGAAPVAPEADTVRTLAAAAARVAECAARDRAVTMRHAACDDYVLVQVQGPEAVSHLLVEKESECRAAFTAH